MIPMSSTNGAYEPVLNLGLNRVGSSLELSATLDRKTPLPNRQNTFFRLDQNERMTLAERIKAIIVDLGEYYYAARSSSKKLVFYTGIIVFQFSGSGNSRINQMASHSRQMHQLFMACGSELYSSETDFISVVVKYIYAIFKLSSLEDEMMSQSNIKEAMQNYMAQDDNDRYEMELRSGITTRDRVLAHVCKVNDYLNAVKQATDDIVALIQPYFDDYCTESIEGLQELTAKYNRLLMEFHSASENYQNYRPSVFEVFLSGVYLDDGAKIRRDLSKRYKGVFDIYLQSVDEVRKSFKLLKICQANHLPLDIATQYARTSKKTFVSCENSYEEASKEVERIVNAIIIPTGYTVLQIVSGFVLLVCMKELSPYGYVSEEDYNYSVLGTGIATVFCIYLSYSRGIARRFSRGFRNIFHCILVWILIYVALRL